MPVKNSPFLRYGDLIVLWCENATEDGFFSGYLARDGTLGSSVCIKEAKEEEAPVDGIRDCVFRICKPYDYAAKQEYDDYLLRLEGVDETQYTGSERAKFDKKREALQKKMTQEMKNNELEGKKYFGDQVSFGDNVQLQHLQSGNFLDVWLGTIADLEPAAIKLHLTEHGSPCCHLTISPRYKIRRLGFGVGPNDDVLLGVNGTNHEHFVHTTVQPTDSGSVEAEVNCFYRPTSFKILRFDRFWGSDNQTLSIGAIVQVRHGYSMLMPSSSHISSLFV